MLQHSLSARPSASASAIDGGYRDEQLSPLLASAAQSAVQPLPALASSPLRRVYFVALAVLVTVGLLLCASLLAASSVSSLPPPPQSSSLNGRSPLSLRPYAPLGATAIEQRGRATQPQQLSSTAHTAVDSGGAPSESSAGPPRTAVSNAAGVRHVVERRYAGYIARENYNIHSSHLLTLASSTQQPPHVGCKPTAEGGSTYQCDIFNLTEALSVCSQLVECVGVVCWKEHWEGCQLKGRPVRHDNNHRFVALYKDAAAVDEAEAAWRQQAEEAASKSQKGQLGTFNPAPCGGGSKCVVSMGLYGSNERYTSNIVVNARLLPAVLPGWLLRVYHDVSVPARVLQSLRAEGAELVDMSRSSLQGAIAGMYWRFMVSEDESVDRWLIRDADCRVSAREAAAVQAWIASGYSVHIMRDHPHHGRRMMGGMWGGVKHALRNMTQRIVAAASDVDNYNGDQEFLAWHVYPHIEFDQLSHDSWTCLSFTNSHPFPSHGRRPFDNSSFVGMIQGKDGDEQLNGDIRCCLIGREATIACRDNIDDKWG